MSGPFIPSCLSERRARLYSLADLVDLGPTERTRTNCCRLAVLHRDRLRVFHLNLSFVLQAVAFHKLTVLLRDSVVGADLPILGARICPRQPQFKLNSGLGVVLGPKNVPKRGLKSLFGVLAKKNEPNLARLPVAT